MEVISVVSIVESALSTRTIKTSIFQQIIAEAANNLYDLDNERAARVLLDAVNDGSVVITNG